MYDPNEVIRKETEAAAERLELIKKRIEAAKKVHAEVSDALLRLKNSARAARRAWVDGDTDATLDALHCVATSAGATLDRLKALVEAMPNES